MSVAGRVGGDPARVSGPGTRALATGSALVMAGALPGMLPAALAVRIRADFPLSAAALGFAVSLLFLASALLSPVCGRVVGRIGPVAGMRVAAAVIATSCLVVAATARSAAALTAGILMAGAGNAMTMPAVSALLQREIARNRLGAAFGAQSAGGSFAGLLAGLSVPLIAIPFGWRWAFVGTAVLAVAAAASAGSAAHATAPDENGAWRPAARGSAARSGAGGSAALRGGGAPAAGSARGLAVASALASAAAVALISFLTLYAIDRGISETEAGLLLAAVGGGSSLSRIVLGAAADRTGGDPLRPVAVLLGIGAVGYLVLAAEPAAAVVLGALLAGTLGWCWHGALTLAVVHDGPGAAATGVGILMAGVFAGAVAGPFLIGLLVERDAFTGAWLVCAACSAGAALIVTGVRRRGLRRAALSGP